MLYATTEAGAEELDRLDGEYEGRREDFPMVRMYNLVLLYTLETEGPKTPYNLGRIFEEQVGHTVPLEPVLGRLRDRGLVEAVETYERPPRTKALTSPYESRIWAETTTNYAARPEGHPQRVFMELGLAGVRAGREIIYPYIILTHDGKWYAAWSRLELLKTHYPDAQIDRADTDLFGTFQDEYEEARETKQPVELPMEVE